MPLSHTHPLLQASLCIFTRTVSQTLSCLMLLLLVAVVTYFQHASDSTLGSRFITVLMCKSERNLYALH
jgi:hypothetical protein